MGNKQSLRDLLVDRDTEYGRAWLVTGRVIKLLNIHLIIDSGYFFNWVMILNKLIRALTTPRNVDHWRDMAGYAILVLDDLESANAAGSKPIVVPHRGHKRVDL